jgi:hypothetical protein
MINAEAVRVFGEERANGLISDLVARWGPILGPIVLKILLQYVGTSAAPVPSGIMAPQHAMATDEVRHWVAGILRQYQPQIEAELTAQVHTIVTAGIDALDT